MVSDKTFHSMKGKKTKKLCKKFNARLTPMESIYLNVALGKLTLFNIKG